jgi:hypothetical protein
LPIGLGVVGIAVALPCGDFLNEGLFIGNPTVEALGREDAEFGFCQIKPTTVLWSVVPFEALEPVAWPRRLETLRRVTPCRGC